MRLGGGGGSDAAVSALAGLFSTWSGFQSGLWTGTQAARYTEYGAMRMEAAGLQAEANQISVIEVTLFTTWVNATVAGDYAVAEFYERRFPANLKTAFDAWRETRPLDDPKAPRSPFVMPQYQRHDREAQVADAKATAVLRAGQAANQISDRFSQGNVMLAMAMFFAGIAQVFRIDHLRFALLGVAVITCVVGVVRVASLPMLHPG